MENILLDTSEYVGLKEILELQTAILENDITTFDILISDSHIKYYVAMIHDKILNRELFRNRMYVDICKYIGILTIMLELIENENIKTCITKLNDVFISSLATRDLTKNAERVRKKLMN